MTVICGRDITFLWCLGGVFTADFSGARGGEKAREWRDCVSRCAGAVSRGQDGASMSDGFTTARRAIARARHRPIARFRQCRGVPPDRLRGRRGRGRGIRPPAKYGLSACKEATLNRGGHKCLAVCDVACYTYCTFEGTGTRVMAYHALVAISPFPFHRIRSTPRRV